MRAVRLASLAIALDPELADGYAARGYAAVALYALPEESIPDLERGLSLRPSAGEIQAWYANTLAAAPRSAPGPPTGAAVAIWAACLRAAGRAPEAAAVIDSVKRERAPRTYTVASDIAKDPGGKRHRP